MKRVFSLVFLVIFITSNVGVIASSYTCKMDRREMMKSGCCSEKDKSCCEKEVKLLKLQSDFLSGSQKTIVPPDLIPVIFTFSPEHQSNDPGDLILSLHDHAPPLERSDRLSFIQSFLI